MTVTVEIDDSDVMWELRRLADGPDQPDRLRLEAAHTQVFYATQAVVHRVTGRLARSGRPSSHYRNRAWTGEIRYGGRGVDYAEYEYERGQEEGEEQHDFLIPAKSRDAAEGYLDAIGDFMRGAV